MTYPTRALLAFVLALAIPLQGFAAASMLLCGPGHAQAAAPMVASPHAAEADAHHHGTGVAHGHAASDHHASASAAIAQDAPAHAVVVDGASKHAPAKLLTGKCSICASCCSGSAIVSAPYALPLVVTASELTVEPASILVGVTLSRLERPPRT